MEEIVLKLGHELPFNNVSRLFPETRIYRWCNSQVDYLEFESPDPAELEKIRLRLAEFAGHLHTSIIFSSTNGTVMTTMVTCRCSNANSTVRMTESADCLWKAPVTYSGGYETLTVISPGNQNFRNLYSSLKNIGSVDIVRKTRLLPNALRDSYTISLSDLFGNMTQKQAGNLATAAAAGYFDIPKGVTLESLAGREKISQSTLQEHVSKAESKLMQAVTPYIRLYVSSVLRLSTEQNM